MVGIHFWQNQLIHLCALAPYQQNLDTCPTPEVHLLFPGFSITPISAYQVCIMNFFALW